MEKWHIISTKYYYFLHLYEGKNAYTCTFKTIPFLKKIRIYETNTIDRFLQVAVQLDPSYTHIPYPNNLANCSLNKMTC